MSWVDTDISLSLDSDYKISTQHAIKEYIDNVLSIKQNILGYTPENIINKDDNTSLGNSNTKYPTQNAVKTYVDLMVDVYSSLPLLSDNSGKFLETDGTITMWSFIDHTNLLNKGTYTHPEIDSHIDNTSNPHNITKTQIGLSNVDNIQQIPIS